MANASGLPNGQDAGCAIALDAGAPGLMLSRCTPSAMIDKAHVFKNMLIVWDDPRDCSQAQLSTIVHEAFHGHATSTVSRGNRQYNSTLIIGTQEHMLGMPYNANNLATFSRLSHVDMGNVEAEWEPDTQSEASLQARLPENADIFAQLLSTRYDAEEVDKLQARLGGGQCDHAPPAHRCDRLAPRVHAAAAGLRDRRARAGRYFSRTTPATWAALLAHVARRALRRHVRQLLHEGVDVPSVFFKPRVTVDLKKFGPTECFAVYPKDFMHFLYKAPRLAPLHQGAAPRAAQDSKYGEVSRNAAFRTEHGTQIRRALVVRRQFLQ